MQYLDPKAVWFFFIKNNIISVLILPYVLALWYDSTTLEEIFASDKEFLEWFLILIASLAFATYYLAHVAYKAYRYELTNNGLKIESGVFLKRSIMIPYNQIQNVDIVRGVVVRLFGLSTVFVQTAGNAGELTSVMDRLFAQGRLTGLSNETAEKLHDELIQRSRS